MLISINDTKILSLKIHLDSVDNYSCNYSVIKKKVLQLDQSTYLFPVMITGIPNNSAVKSQSVPSGLITNNTI